MIPRKDTKFILTTLVMLGILKPSITRYQRKVVRSMRINKELLKGSTVIIILTLLDRQPMYGYEMLAEIERSSDGVFQFKEGTLYPILHVLESEGYVESYWNETESTRKRKYYRITKEGRTHLTSKRSEWALFRSAIDRVIGEGALS